MKSDIICSPANESHFAVFPLQKEIFYKFTLKAGGQTVGYINQNLSKTGVFKANKTRYILTDHLGSSDVVTDERGLALLKLSFDAWGKRRNDTWSNTTPTELETIIAGFADEAYKIGYTGHEHDDEVGLINMKGRLYDAEIGRFISADPYVQAATDTQSYNRYSYVRNNPLSLTDPSGYSWLSKLWKGITRFVKKWGRTILAIAATNLLLELLLLMVRLWRVQQVDLLGGLISTGSLSGALKGALFGALSAGLARGIGHGYDKFFGRFGRFAKHAKAVAHGIAQGTVSVLKGGKFGAGFISAFGAKISLEPDTWYGKVFAGFKGFILSNSRVPSSVSWTPLNEEGRINLYKAQTYRVVSDSSWAIDVGNSTFSSSKIDLLSLSGGLFELNISVNK